MAHEGYWKTASLRLRAGGCVRSESFRLQAKRQQAVLLHVSECVCDKLRALERLYNIRQPIGGVMVK